MNQKYKELIERLDKEKVKENVFLAEYTTFKIGGPADLFIEIDSEEELVKVVGTVREVEIPYFILGNGSNVLVGDGGFRGLVIKVKSSKFKIQNYGLKFKVFVETGVLISKLINELKAMSISGLEFMAGIPGTVGGAIRGNAGAWQQNIGDKVRKVKVLNSSGGIKWIDSVDCLFSYRDSRFKRNNEIILEVEFELDKGEQKEIETEMNELLSKRACQPKEPSAGCIFINPKPQSAGELIEQCGLKGKAVGGAQLSEKHANFIINTGLARAVDVVALIDLVKKEVLNKFNIELKEEIVKIGEF